MKQANQLQPLQRPLHTWYVEARNAPATFVASLSHECPNVSSATARLRAFSYGYRVHFHLTGVVHQTARSRPASAYQPSRRHVGGTGSKNVRLDTRLEDDFANPAKGRVFRTKPPIVGKSAAAYCGIHQDARSATLRGRCLTTGEHRAKKREDRQGGGVYFCFPVGTSAASRKTKFPLFHRHL